MAFIRKEGKYYKIYFNIGNKKFKRSSRTTSRKIADNLRKKIENDIAQGIFQLANYSPHLMKSLSEFFDEAKEYSKINKAKRTCEREMIVYRNFLGFCDDIPISNVSVKLIESYKAHLQHERGFTPNGINIELRTLSAAFSLAFKYEYIATNPFKNVKKVRTPKKIPKFLSKMQAKELLRKTRHKSIYEHILIALNTGARVSEICNLQWKDVDLQNRLIKFNGKGSKERTVPIPEALYAYLRNRTKESEHVVTGSRNRGEISRQFRHHADQLGIDITFHNLRDTYASWLVQNGVNLKIIQELLGHESIQTTLIYAHLSPDNKFQAVSVIDKLINP